MKRLGIIVGAALMVMSGAGQAGMYKCTDPATGAVTYSQLPCATDAKEVDVNVHRPTPAQVQEAERIARKNQDFIDSGLERRRAALVAAAAARKAEKLEKARAAERRVIRAKRAMATNNFAGATYLNALSSDEAQMDQRYDRQLERLNNTVAPPAPKQ